MGAELGLYFKYLLVSLLNMIALITGITGQDGAWLAKVPTG